MSERAETWYNNWLHEFMDFGPEKSNLVPSEFNSWGKVLMDPQERQSIRLMLMCFAALQAEDLGI